MTLWIILYVLMLVWVWEMIRYDVTHEEAIIIMIKITAAINAFAFFGLGFGLRCIGG